MRLTVSPSDAVPLVVDLSEEPRLLMSLASLDLLNGEFLNLSQNPAANDLSHDGLRPGLLFFGGGADQGEQFCCQC